MYYIGIQAMVTPNSKNLIKRNHIPQGSFYLLIRSMPISLKLDVVDKIGALCQLQCLLRCFVNGTCIGLGQGSAIRGSGSGSIHLYTVAPRGLGK